MPGSKPSPAAAIYREVQAGRQDIKNLHPLLALLDPPEGQKDGGNPLDEIKELLESILLAIRHQQAEIADLTTQIEALREGRTKRSAGSASGPQ